MSNRLKGVGCIEEGRQKERKWVRENIFEYYVCIVSAKVRITGGDANLFIELIIMIANGIRCWIL